jgi:hypothetical protein
MVWVSLALIGLLLLLIVRQSVARVTRTPWWLLWLVLMIPALLMLSWSLIYGPKQPVPSPLLVGSFILSSGLYFFLVQRGRINPTAADATAAAETAAERIPEIKPLDKAAETQLQSCFPWSVYYLQQIEYRPQAVICRGQLKSQPELAYQTVRDNIVAQFGDRFLVVFQLGASNKPFFALVLNPQAAQQRPNQQAAVNRPGLALGLMLGTLLTTTLAGVELSNPGFTGQNLSNNPAMLLTGLGYALSIMGILGIHEIGHYVAAAWYKVRTTLPYFIPIPLWPGTCGAYTQRRSPIPNRKALFDIGIAGTLAGLLVLAPVLIWGLLHSNLVPLPEQPPSVDKPQVPILNPSVSMLLLLCSKLVFADQLTVKMGITLHPVAIAGCIGLVFQALNLIPVGQLDGGHIVHAMFGQRAGAAIGQISRLLLLLLAFAQPVLLFLAIPLFFIPAFDEPALNDVTELDNLRDFLGLLALTLLLLIILPVPGFISEWLLAANPAP